VGEGAFIAIRGSIIGVGMDIDGSIRVPTAFNGLYGFRPSVGDSSWRSAGSHPPGTDGFRSTVGPMATSHRDCSLFKKLILKADTWRYESTSMPIPWIDLQPEHKLRIGVALDNSLFTLAPPVRCGLNLTGDFLRANSDIQIVPITLPDVKPHYQDLIGYFTLSGGDASPLDPSRQHLN
jgi:amidase